MLDVADVVTAKAGQHRPHAARNVKADAAGRDHALLRIERGDTADREAIPPNAHPTTPH